MGIPSRSQAKERKDVRLYYGVNNEDTEPFKGLVPQWEASGVKVITVFSDRGTGYVQDVFKQVCC
jgi:hypothetical protein